MRVLLDTHTLIWWANDHPRLSPKARSILGSLSSEVFVSAASAWELTTKVRLGKLPEAEEFSADFARNVELLGFRELAISVGHGQHAGTMHGSHKDPFDRMLIAQSIAESLPLLSNDSAFDQYLVNRIW